MKISWFPRTSDEPPSTHAVDPSAQHRENLQRASETSYSEALIVLRARLRDLRDQWIAYRDAPMPLRDSTSRLRARGSKIEVATIRKTLNVVIAELDAALLVDPLTRQEKAE